MKVRYFADTHTLLIEFRDSPVAETRDLDENTVLDVDTQGNILADALGSSYLCLSPTVDSRRLHQH